MTSHERPVGQAAAHDSGDRGGGGVTSPFRRFSFYSDPRRLIKNPCGGVTVGLGEGDDGTELLYLNVGDGYRNDGDVLLTADELTDLIDQLTIIRNAMRLT
ncbi:hypothetical protein PBI_SQUIRTY_42 [Mycobacterium phage Squirty]|uniref:DUF7304 domain-containing protein n=1 Tax=Mycobacterium phage Squirty TaxID=1527512 RepID=A0A088FBN0_9CAUD|nr:hypothetical protein PBI_SQUIRTY_42 [Mycobacterium phage Squirty]AIM40989.1 hypothetical protein PBI_SQUIRTY_42 [Mycobacterium phage Squirty]